MLDDIKIVLLMDSVSHAFVLVVPGGKTPDISSRDYSQILREQILKGEESQVAMHFNCFVSFLFFIKSISTENYSNKNYLVMLIFLQLRKKIQEKSKDGTLVKSSNGDASKAASEPRKRGRWDQTIDEQFVPAKKAAGAATPTWNDVEKTPALAGETPGATPRTQR